MERHLQKHSWISVKKLVPGQINTVIFPAGTVEAHGAACTGTDNFIPELIAEGIAERLNALIAPTLNYGITRSLYRYNGGITITESTYQSFVGDILHSFADIGFHNVILLNGHGGNNNMLKAAAMEFHRRDKTNVAVIHWWELCGEMTREFFGHVGGHAGTDETALVQSIDPALGGQADYKPELAYYMQPGADVYPVPGSILLYKEGEGYPNYDLSKVKAYREKVVAMVGDFAAMVLERWARFGL
jgi:creatinine amidohydrolase